MSNSEFTKLMIAQGFKRLLKTSSFVNLSVGDIARECGISRNTFYYHFQDKYALISWIFCHETRQILGPAEDLSPARWRTVLLSLCRYMQDNRDFYLNILQFQGQNSFPHCLLEFLQNLCCHMLSCDNLPALPPHQLRLLSRFFAYGITGVIMDWTKSGMSLDPEPGVDLLEKLLSNHMIHQALLGQLEPREGTEEGDVSFVHIV